MRDRNAGARAAATMLCLAVVTAYAQSGSAGEPFALTASQLLEQGTSLPLRDGHAAVFQTMESRFELDERQRLTWSTYQVYRVDSEEGIVALGQVVVPWDPGVQSGPEIRARVVTRDGREHWFDQTTLSDEHMGDPDPRIFSDVRMLRGPLPAITVGSVVEISVRIAEFEPLFQAGRLLEVILGIGAAVEQTTIVVSAPATLPLRHAIQLLPDADVTELVEDGRRVITLRQGPLALDPVKQLMAMVGGQPSWPRFVFSTGESWAAVATAYADMAEPFVRPDEVRTLLPVRLPEDRNSRIARLLELLHDRVRYTGVLFGVGKLVPNPPSVTLERRFGDCKDKAVVFTSMLRAAGVPAQLALVNSGIAPDVSAELPGMGGFNHMIVRVPGERPLYIDPTAEHMKVGELPTEIQGRHVLVIAGDGTALQRTPDPQPADQRRHIVKELRLPDYGRADLAISVRENGAEAARNRPALAGHGEVATGQREDILKAAYGATSIAGFEQADDPASGDLTYRFEARGVSTASTDFDEAVVRERFDGLFNRVPVYLRMSDAARGHLFNGDDGADEPAPRTADWIFEPFVTELKLQITLPRGFHSRGLPDDRELRFGPASLSQRFGIDEMGRVYATIRADSGSGRYTAEEGDAFRRSFLENGSALSLELRFEHEAIALLQAGDEPGALRRHRELIAEEPGKSIHRIRAARRFMAFGLVDEAREQARLAIEMEPRSALAYSTHGLMLEYNEHGVRFGRGFDRDGAIKAHRESTVLDEEKRWYHGNLAIVAERGVDGSRYGPGADLELAIDSYRKYVADDPGWAAGADLLIECLWHANRYNDIATIAVDPAPDAPALPYQLAARVMTVGVQPALREDSARGDLAVRRRRIERAIQLLFAARHYEQAQQLMATIGQEGRGGGEMEPVLVQLMPNTRRVEQLPAPPATASGAAESVMRIAFEPGTTIKDFAPWISRHASRRDDMEPLARQLQDAARRLRHPLTLVVGDDGALVRDIVVGNLEYRESAAPGDARRVTVLMRDIAVVTLLMVRDGDHWRLLTMSPQWYLIGREALARLDAGDLPTARAWLEFVREDTERNAFYDESPWFGQLAAVLPRELADEESALRLAAHLLLAGPVTVAGTIEDFRHLEPLATTAERRMAWHWMIYRAAGEAGDYEQQVSIARVMHAEDSTAADAYLRLSTAQGQAGHWQEAESTAREWLAKHRSDGRAPRALAQALNALGRAEEGLALLASRVQAGRADSVQLNGYAWQALIADAVDERAITAAENAFNLRSQRDYATGHTLACLYAAAGRITEARDLMQSLFDEFPSADPDDASAWLLRGLIFEQLGETTAASRAYRKVGVSVPLDPNSSQAIASARLAKLVHR